MLTAENSSAYIPAESTIAIAFSGGGDSTALVHMLRDYRPRPRVFIVNHGLRPGALQEAQAAKAFAKNLGFSVNVMTWEHDNPSSGIQQKARKARYHLMGQACRTAGIEYLLTGHTQDDQAETLLMRYERGTGWRGAAGMAHRIYAPLWPELIGVTLIRPLLGQTRKSLRDYNRNNSLSWAEDPSNQDQKYARIRARQKLHSGSALRALFLETAIYLRQGLEFELSHFRHFFQEHGRCDQHGMIFLRQVPPIGLLEMILRVVSGTGGPVDKAALRHMKSAMHNKIPHSRTLAGAYVSHKKGEFCFSRDPVAAKGRANQPQIAVTSLPHGRECIWDGRFAIRAKRPELTVGPLLSLPLGVEAFKAGTPDITLPAIWNADGQCVAWGGTADHADVDVRSLVASRLHNMLRGNPAGAVAAYK